MSAPRWIRKLLFELKCQTSNFNIQLCFLWYQDVFENLITTHLMLNFFVTLPCLQQWACSAQCNYDGQVYCRCNCQRDQNFKSRCFISLAHLHDPHDPSSSIKPVVMSLFWSRGWRLDVDRVGTNQGNFPSAINQNSHQSFVHYLTK